MNESEMIAKWDEHIGYEFSTRDVSLLPLQQWWRTPMSTTSQL